MNRWSLLFLLSLSPVIATAAPDFQSRHLAIGLSRTAPAFSAFAVDSLGQGKLSANPVLAPAQAVAGLELAGQTYQAAGRPVWAVSWSEKSLSLRSVAREGGLAPPFSLTFDQKANHATLLGIMKPGERKVSLPCVLHLPDMGTLRITCNVPGAQLDYDARRRAKPAFVRIDFPPATAAQPLVEYRLEVVSIHPTFPGIDPNPLYDGFRRDWLNIFQVNPRVQMLANNASSDPCSFTLFEYSDLARHTPPLAPGLTANDLIRMTLDRYLAGALGYGQVGYACQPVDADLIPWPTPFTSLDTLPSLLISACNYVEGSGDRNWARGNYAKLASWGREMFAADKDGNGLIEYPGSGNLGDRPTRERRPSNWWDTVNFGHEDAFANALAYRAGTMFAALARQLGSEDDARFFGERSAKLRASYAPALLNPATGLLAGWKSADGQLHDYAFTFVQGMAVTFGLLEEAAAHAVMDRLLAKLQAVGYARFELGLPGNLIPVRRGDYVDHDTPPEVHGVPRLEDGSDGFQYYENGGATGCWAYYTVKALYQLGRVADAQRIFHPMLAGYARGEFQGFGANGMSRDWRDWQGGCHGYEGLLVDNYHALLAVMDDAKAMAAGANPQPLAALAPGSRILFQGDSITDGNRGRNLDPNHILGHGYAFILAAKFGAAFPEARLDFVNRGVSGNTVLDLEKRWKADTLDLKPDVLSILIGVNDKGRGVPLEQYEQVYDKLLAGAKAANPKIKLVLCEPFVLDTRATGPQHGAASPDIVQRQQIVARLAQKHGAALVHFQGALDRATRRAPVSHWIWDGVHPTYSGHQILADEWEQTVREFWK